MALFDCHHSWGHTLAALLTCHCSLKAPLKLDRTAHIPSSPTVLRSTSHQGCLPIHPSLLPHYIIPPPFSASSFPSFEPERDGFHSLSLSLACSRNSKKTATKASRSFSNPLSSIHRNLRSSLLFRLNRDLLHLSRSRSDLVCLLPLNLVILLKKSFSCACVFIYFYMNLFWSS